MTARRLASRAVGLAAVLAAVTLSSCSGDSDPAPTTVTVTEQPSGTSSASPTAEQPQPLDCTSPTTTVTKADELTSALAAAAPGDRITLGPGTYEGTFVAATSGTAEAPITLCGPTDAVLDGGGTDSGYVVHLDGASYWMLSGFTVTNGQKGVMADGTVGSTITGLTVTHIGDEAIHLRRASTDNTVSGNTISDTGLRKEKFGEGVYVGTAESNWCDVTDCQPDASDRNTIEGNTISGTTSEAVDLKEGTSDGVLRNNTFDGSMITGADSWVDVKGNGWLIEGNTGVNSPKDGFQTHEILDGWGDHNVFTGNSATVNGPGVGFSLTPVLNNVVECDNTVSDAAKGVSNVTCSS